MRRLYENKRNKQRKIQNGDEAGFLKAFKEKIQGKKGRGNEEKLKKRIK